LVHGIGYGQRNKSYLFKDGQVCGKGSYTCACANVFEGTVQKALVLPLNKGNEVNHVRSVMYQATRRT
jgi:hypothetical protein